MKRTIIIISTITVSTLLYLSGRSLPAEKYEFENFGVMIPEAGDPYVLHGPGPSGEIDTIYLMFNNQNGGWFMVAVDTKTGKSAQYNSGNSADPHPKSTCVGPDGKIYVGSVAGILYVFDPKQPKKGIENLGKACKGEGYLFSLSNGMDGKLYMGSYPNGKLLSYDPKSGQFADHGRAADDEMYTQFVAPLNDTYAYAEAGVVRHRVVRINLKTARRQQVDLPKNLEPEYCKIYLGKDGRVYSYLVGPNRWSIIEGTHMKLIEDNQVKRKYGVHSIPGSDFKYDWAKRRISFINQHGAKKVFNFDYHDAALLLFMLEKGPGSKIYGSSYIPIRIFEFDMKTRKAAYHPYNPFQHAGGEVYSILVYSPEKIYMGAYGDADFIVYDSTKPWKTNDKGYAQKEGTNPIYLGTLGDDQNRPYDMIKGPDGYVYIATTADYGKVGGAVTKLDPKTNTWTVYRNCVPNQFITALATIPGEKKLFAGGSMSAATGYKELGVYGDAELFLWDTSKDTITYRTHMPLKGMHSILQLESTEDGILIGACYGIERPQHLFAFDQKKRTFLYCEDISKIVGGKIGAMSLFSKPYKGTIYFIANGKIFTIDTKTYKVEKAADYPGAFRGGVLVRDPGKQNRMAYYFITRTELVAMYLEQ